MKRGSIVCVALLSLIFFAGSADAAPTATGANRPLLQDTTVRIVPWVDDSDVSDTFTFHVLTPPANGSAVAVKHHSALQYTPNTGFTGTDSFTFRATDQNGNLVDGTAQFRIYDAASAFVKCTRQRQAGSRRRLVFLYRQADEIERLHVLRGHEDASAHEPDGCGAGDDGFLRQLAVGGEQCA